MPFASTDDVAGRLGRELSADEEQSVSLLLDGAAAAIAEAADKDDDWAAALDPVPESLRFLSIELVCRAIANPSSLSSVQEQLGQHNYSASFRGAGLSLTKAEELRVRRTVWGTTTGSARIASVLEDLYPCTGS